MQAFEGSAVGFGLPRTIPKVVKPLYALEFRSLRLGGLGLAQSIFRSVAMSASAALG
jgi:hypothetical protein